MSDLKISQGTATAPLVDTDAFPLARVADVTPRKAVLSDLKAYMAIPAATAFSLKAANFNAATNNIYALTANALTVTYPAAPAVGDWFEMVLGAAAVLSVTTSRNGNLINSAAADITIPNFGRVRSEFVGGARGWSVLWVPNPFGILDLSQSTAGQIKFPSTANLSSDPNTLDAYAEGTWTPGVSFGAGATGITYTTQTARYTRVGRQLQIEMRMTLSNKGSSTGTALLTGLPFSTSPYGGFAFGEFQNMGASLNMLMGYAVGNTTVQLLNAASGTTAVISDTAFTNTSELIGGGALSI